MSHHDHTPAYRILFVGERLEADQTTEVALQHAGFDVKASATFHSAMQQMHRQPLPDLLLVAAGSDCAAAFDFCRAVQRFSDLPMVLIVDDRNGGFVAQALDEFAEDVVTRPYSPAILTSRVQRILRRFGHVNHQMLAIEWPRRRLSVGETAVVLSPLESRLLYILLRGHGESVASEYILRRLWPAWVHERNNVRTAVFRLRRKLKCALGQDVIVASSGGYVLQTPALDHAAVRASGD